MPDERTPGETPEVVRAIGEYFGRQDVATAIAASRQAQDVEPRLMPRPEARAKIASDLEMLLASSQLVSCFTVHGNGKITINDEQETLKALLEMKLALHEFTRLLAS